METGYPMGTYNSGKHYDAVPPFSDERSKGSRWGARDSSENLVGSAAPMGYHHQRSTSPESEAERQPTVPDMGYRGGGGERRVI